MKSIFRGVAKAYASEHNPLQTLVELVITPFSVNRNKQAIPRSEAENILRTCMHQPIKVDLQGQTIGGHKDAYPVGTITTAEITDEAIIGRGVIWTEEYPEVAELLKKRTAENDPPGTSWEILFARSEVIDGIEYLYDTYYAANTLVSNPSYGDQTLIRAIAEDLQVHMEEEKDTTEPIVEKTEASLDDERAEIMMLQNDLANLYNQLDTLYWKTFDIEEAEAAQNPTANLQDYMTRFTSLMDELANRANTAGVALAETTTTLDTLQIELNTLKIEVESLRAEKAQAEETQRINTRVQALAEVGIELDDTNRNSLLSLDDNQFTLFVSSLKQVRGKSTAETHKIKLPEIVTSHEIDIEDIKTSHSKLFQRGKKN